MKCVIIFIVVVTLFLLETESTSPVKCSGKCDPSMCQPVDCTCGSYLDQCGCCSYCYKCPGQQCSFVARDRCLEDYECKHTEEANGLDFYNTPGICAAMIIDEYEEYE